MQNEKKQFTKAQAVSKMKLDIQNINWKDRSLGHECHGVEKVHDPHTSARTQLKSNNIMLSTFNNGPISMAILSS